MVLVYIPLTTFHQFHGLLDSFVLLFSLSRHLADAPSKVFSQMSEILHSLGVSELLEKICRYLKLVIQLGNVIV